MTNDYTRQCALEAKQELQRLSKIAKKLALEIHQHRSGVWEYVGERIRKAFLADAILDHFIYLDSEALDGHTATWAIRLMDDLISETGNVLKEKYLMPVYDEEDDEDDEDDED